MKKNLLIILILSVFLGQYGVAQVSINEDGSEPHSSAMLDIKSADKGLLVPRMTTSEIEEIYLPADGLQVYNTETGKLYIFVENDFEWKEVNYAPEGIHPIATYTIGTGGSCNNTVVHGVYYESVLLKSYNYVTIEVNVSTLGQYTLTTDTVNGYSFYASGVFTSVGVQNVDLAGSGIPTSAQTDIFTIVTSVNESSCTFDIPVVVSSTFLCGMEFQDPRDGQMYNTVEIGTQCWMAENMNIGTMIHSTTGGTNGDGEQTDNGTIEKYCYNNEIDSCNIYGGLYQWNEVMQYITTEGVQGICPSSWHLPTDDEWKILEIELGMSQPQANATGFRGTDEGSKLAANESIWLTGNLDQNANFGTSGFAALPAGYQYTNGSFSSLAYRTFFWSSSENGTSARYRFLHYDYTKVNRNNFDKAFGLSVRCLKN